jgi:hypothetical protein
VRGADNAGITMDVEIYETKEFLKAVKTMKLAGGPRARLRTKYW